MQNLLPNVKVSLPAIAAGSAGSLVAGATVDMDGYEGVLLLTRISTANAGNFLKAQQGDQADGSDASDLAGTATVAAADGDLVVLDVYRPTGRYVRPVIDRSGTNTATGDVYALRYGGRLSPQDNNVADVIVSKLVSSPSEGTP